MKQIDLSRNVNYNQAPWRPFPLRCSSDMIHIISSACKYLNINKIRLNVNIEVNVCLFKCYHWHLVALPNRLAKDQLHQMMFHKHSEEDWQQSMEIIKWSQNQLTNQGERKYNKKLTYLRRNRFNVRFSFTFID